MLRATITAVCMSILVFVFSVPLLISGFIRPSRRLFAFFSNLWAGAVLNLSGVNLKVVGVGHIADRQPRFYVANHQSALDIPILLRVLGGDVRFLAKKALFRIPMFGWVLTRYGYAPIDRENARRALRSVERMLCILSEHPTSVAVFPEGTRSRDGKLLPFRRGTMKICQQSGLAVVPVTIDGSIRVHHRDHFRAMPGSVTVIIHEPISANDVRSLSSTELTNRVVQAIQQRLQSDRPIAAASAGIIAKAEVA